MTKRAEKLSVAVAGFGAIAFLASLAWALPGYVALGVGGVLLAVGAVGVKALRDLMLYGAAGVEEAEKRQSEAEPD